MSKHHCHALGCKRECPPRWLMCRACWAKVPASMAAEVYRTVKLRGNSCDESWAPWWRAQAKAIDHVARTDYPEEKDRIDRLYTRELAFAERLEAGAARTPDAGRGSK